MQARPPLLRTATLIEQVPPVQAPVPGVSFSGYIELVEIMRRQALTHARRARVSCHAVPDGHPLAAVRRLSTP
jgi:hypothetical protein